LNTKPTTSMYHTCPTLPLMQARNASHEPAEVYEVTRYMILLKYEHQTSSKHHISQEGSFSRNAWPS